MSRHNLATIPNQTSSTVTHVKFREPKLRKVSIFGLPVIFDMFKLLTEYRGYLSNWSAFLSLEFCFLENIKEQVAAKEVESVTNARPIS